MNKFGEHIVFQTLEINYKKFIELCNEFSLYIVNGRMPSDCEGEIDLKIISI